MGLIMLVLIGIVPATYTLDMTTNSQEIAAMVEAAKGLEHELSHPQIVEVMEALKEEHLATTRVEQLWSRDLARTEAGWEPRLSRMPLSISTGPGA